MRGIADDSGISWTSGEGKPRWRLAAPPRSPLSQKCGHETHLGMTPAYKNRSAAFRAAMSRSAERRQCPKCNRKSALIRLPTDLERGLAAMTYCRWEDCDYERHFS